MSRRLAEIPGIGPIVATALVAEIGDWKAFRSGRNLAAWIGLVPKQHTTGGKDRLGSITKQGNRYFRWLLSSTWGPFEALGPLRGPFGALGAPSGPLRGLRPFGPRLRPRPSGALNDLGQTNKAFYLDELRIGWISIGQHVSVYSAVVLGYSKAYYYR